MILSFKPQFVARILDGSKIHSFREDPNSRWKEGKSIQMATGIRTKAYNCFKEDNCTKVQECKLVNHPSSVILVIDNCIFHWNMIIHIAKNDGFDDPYDFVNFFFGDHNKYYGEKTLRLIHWTDFKYDYSFKLNN